MVRIGAYNELERLSEFKAPPVSSYNYLLYTVKEMSCILECFGSEIAITEVIWMCLICLHKTHKQIRVCYRWGDERTHLARYMV